MSNEKPKVVRVTSTEFELDDGRIFPHPEELEDVPSLEEFQEHYDRWSELLGQVDGKAN